jgi:hypothetical protein
MQDWERFENFKTNGSPFDEPSPSQNLKRCPLCSAENSRTNSECHVCGWHGAFEYDEPEPSSSKDEFDRAIEMYEREATRKGVRFHEIMRKLFWPVD